MSDSEDLFARALKLMPGGVNSPVRAFRSVGGTPFFTREARGATLITVEGRELIDFVCTWGPAIHGHNHPAIRSAIAAALDRGTSFGTPNPLEVDMAEQIIRFFPSIQKVRLCNSGTEATMSAVRLARGFTGRSKIVKFAGCYHGHSDSLLIKAGSGALTHGHPDSAGIPEAFARETVVLPFNDPSAVDAAFTANPGAIAAIIIEPFCGNVGLIPAAPGFLQHVRQACTKAGALLIFDEVMTGFRLSRAGVQGLFGDGRSKIGDRVTNPHLPSPISDLPFPISHLPFPISHLPSPVSDLLPDLTCLGKIIGGGLPVGAFGGRAEIMDKIAPLGPVYQAGTLSGNPLALAAGLASLKLLDEQNPYDRLDRITRTLAESVSAAAHSKGLPVQVPQSGSMFTIFFNDKPVSNYADALKSDAKTFGRFFNLCLEKGVFLPPSQYEAAFVSTAHDGPAISRAAEVMADSIKRL